MGSNSCFSKIIADVFPPWHRVNTHLNAAEQQADKTSAFIEVYIYRPEEFYKKSDVLHFVSNLMQHEEKYSFFRDAVFILYLFGLQ